MGDGYGKVRDSDLQILRNRLIDAIGKTETDRLIAEGASRGIDEALQLIQDWLLNG